MSTGDFRTRLVLLIVPFLIAGLVSCAPTPRAQRTILERQGTIGGLSQESFAVSVDAGDRLQIVLSQAGLDLSLRVTLDSQELGRYESFTGRYGEDRVVIDVPGRGPLHVTVGAARFPDVQGSYHLIVTAGGPFNAADQQFTDGSRMDRSSKDRIESFERAADLFARQGRSYEEGLSSFAALTLLNLTASDSKSAIANGERAVDALRIGTNNLLRAAAFNALAAAQGEAGNLDSMSKYFSEARQIYESNGSEIGAAEVELFDAALRDKGRYSEDLLNTYLGVVRKCASLHELICESFALMDLALQVRNRGDFSLALDYLYQALKLVDPIADSGTYAEVHENLASTLRMIGDFDSALYHHKHALEGYSAFGECSGISRSYYGMGYALLGIGDNEQALRFYRLALDRSCRAGVTPANHAWSGRRAPEIGELCELAAPFDKADSDDRAVAAWTAWDLGNLARSESKAEVALHCHRTANKLATFDRHMLGTQLELVRDLLDLGQDADAKSVFEKIDAKVVAENPWYQAQRKEVAAQLEAASGNFRQAITGYGDAAAAYRAVGNFEGVFSALGRRASMAALKDDRRAAEYFSNAEVALEDVRLLSLDPVFSATLFASGRRIYEEWIATLLRLESRDPAKANTLATLAISERSRARLLSQVASASQIGRMGQSARLRSLAGTTLVVLKAAEAGHLPPKEEMPDSPPDNSDQIKRMLGLDRGQLDQPAVTAATYSIERFRQSLGDGTAIVEFFVGEKDAYAWVLQKRLTIRADLGASEPIRSAAAALEEVLTSHSGEGDPRPQLARLYDLIWQPLGITAQINRIEIVPDDVLYSVPFAALWNSAEGRFLVERATLSTLPSIGFAISRDQSSSDDKAANQALLVGDPVYEVEDARQRCSPDARGQELLPQVPKLRRIPASGREIAEIASIFRARSQSVSVLTGCEATREQVLGLRANDYRFIHFATHATADRVLPQRSTIHLSGWNRQGKASPAALTAADLIDNPFHSALVVLSGCSTAGGRQIGGEGSLGLTFSLLASGSRNVISTLWPVSDAASEAAMNYLYADLVSRNQTPAQALRGAQLEMLAGKRWSHPRHWAAYSLLGT